MNLQFLVQKKRNMYLCTHKPTNFFQHKTGVLMTRYFEDYLLLRVKTTGIIQHYLIKHQNSYERKQIKLYVKYLPLPIIY
ncbi:hypothetical protein AXF22_10120 [Prevotella scopos JCM 17725]|uniref:Uncharacterized protein n=1 Tax=Prevotella scopos JCM 17725 TaxID=1236518 RepID=A0AAX2F336_9BACT|nr:hypothetical protein AXF22_10120 [Prevotella scopos JCM 17725]SHF75420.1 hypothetical protein SAMN05444364_10835 [Prevotella scopos JCM 17725]